MKNEQISIETVGVLKLSSGLNLITVANSELYLRLIAKLSNDIEDDIIYSYDNKIKPLCKSGLLIGDPVSGRDIRGFYSKFVPKILAQSISEEGIHELFQLNQKIQSVIASEIIDNNLPFEISQGWELERLLHSQNIVVEKGNNSTIFGKIEEVIHVMGMLDESRYLFLTNASLYCKLSDLNQLHECLLAEGVNLISIDLSLEKPNFSDEHYCHLHIDQDFVLYS
ncbi:type II-A CRISPR-associated protein Csn2 [Fructobacillus fructosus]|uniref:type II-A CRISPR-associated protein Csn2 n=1 Tax=Fructobacillus fructosus TaxID=1631 RepID=UPI001658A4DE|nr:type II-A CRISPR-associated protein Csn2 [Fructobacillus fructosus]MBC9119235.1 type II-A CRISPR-associated protein Csn2 [Fructobacillus fructosus]MBD9366531.1 type II-A CRISPR-associated protein Csn2 [Leuconostoc mesenteroides]